METVVLDTNTILRLIVGDNRKYHKIARHVFKNIEAGKVRAYISLLVLNETVWMLGKFYGYDRKDFAPELRKLFSLKGVVFIEVKKQLVMEVLDVLETTNFDLTDIYLSKIAKKSELVSFDKDFEKLYKLK